MDPAVSVEVIDAFGNRTDFASEVELTLIEAPCGGNLGDAVAVASDGVATFAGLTLDTPCVGDVLKAAAPGAFPPPDPNIDDPTIEGGELTITSPRVRLTFPLPARRWKALGKRRDGTKGFRFGGAGCRAVVIKPNAVKATCKLAAGTLSLPETGPVDFVLAIGNGGTRYCGTCGGTVKGNASKIFKRKDCATPVRCP